MDLRTSLSNAAPILAGRQINGAASARLTIDGRSYINFSGCGYLALSGIPEIRAAVQRALDEGVPFSQQFVASKGAIDPIFQNLERTLAATFRAEASVYFASGYFIGAVGLAALEESYDVIFLDENAHYNLKDAARSMHCQTHAFSHCDADSLRTALRTHLKARQRPLVVSDGVFPVTGRVPPLAEYAAELEPYGGRLFIDEAHSFGVVGEAGRGAAEYCGVESVATIGATLSKAFCAHGAFVVCSANSACHLRSLPCIRGSCAGSPLSAAAATASLSYVSSRPGLRTALRATADYFRRKLRDMGLDVIDTPAPIVSFKWGKLQDMLWLQRRAFDRGILINHSTYVGAGEDGLIVCALFRDHIDEDIDALIEVLR